MIEEIAVKILGEHLSICVLVIFLVITFFYFLKKVVDYIESLD